MAERDTTARKPGAATRADLEAIVGDIDEAKVIEILELRPTVADLELAAVWLAGEDDVLGKAGHRPAGVAAQVLEILAAGDEEEEP